MAFSQADDDYYPVVNTFRRLRAWTLTARETKHRVRFFRKGQCPKEGEADFVGSQCAFGSQLAVLCPELRGPQGRFRR